MCAPPHPNLISFNRNCRSLLTQVSCHNFPLKSREAAISIGKMEREMELHTVRQIIPRMRNGKKSIKSSKEIERTDGARDTKEPVFCFTTTTKVKIQILPLLRVLYEVWIPGKRCAE